MLRYRSATCCGNMPHGERAQHRNAGRIHSTGDATMKQNYKAVLAVATMMGASLAFSAAAQQYGSKPMAPQIPAAQPAANSFTAPQSRPASLYSDWRDYMP